MKGFTITNNMVDAMVKVRDGFALGHHMLFMDELSGPMSKRLLDLGLITTYTGPKVKDRVLLTQEGHKVLELVYFFKLRDQFKAKESA